MMGKFLRMGRYDRQNSRTNRPKNSCTERLVFGKRAAQEADRRRIAERNITWISCSFGYRIDVEGDELLFPSEDQIVTMIRRDPTSAVSLLLVDTFPAASLSCVLAIVPQNTESPARASC